MNTKSDPSDETATTSQVISGKDVSEALPSYFIPHASKETTQVSQYGLHGHRTHLSRKSRKAFKYKAEDDVGTNYGGGIEQWRTKRDFRLRTQSLNPFKEPIAPGIYTRIRKSVLVEQNDGDEDETEEEGEEEEESEEIEEEEEEQARVERIREREREEKTGQDEPSREDQVLKSAFVSSPSPSFLSESEPGAADLVDHETMVKREAEILDKAHVQDIHGLVKSEPLLELPTPLDDSAGTAMDTETAVTVEVLNAAKDDVSVVNLELPVIQEFILDSQFSITIEGRSSSPLKQLFYCIFCIASLGIVYLFAKWFPKLRSILTTNQSSLSGSTHVFVTNSYGQTDFVAVKRSYYGSLLTEIFGSQRVHECLVVEAPPPGDALLADEGDAHDRSPFSHDRPAASHDDDDPTATLSILHDSLSQTSDPPDLGLDYRLSDLIDEPILQPESSRANTLLYNYSCQPGANAIEAAHVDVIDTSSLASSIKRRHQDVKPSSSDFLYYFDYQCIRFLYHPNTGRYFKNSQWESFQSTDYKKLTSGLSKSLQSQRAIIYGMNAIDIRQRSVVQLSVDEALHPFNIFLMMSVLLWCVEEYYYYAAAIFIISAFSVGLNVAETKRNMENLKKMASFNCHVNVLRNGKWTQGPSNELVPGDVFEVHMGMNSTVPCDALLLEGDCIVNESMLTGESLPVSKVPIEESLWNGHGGDDEAHVQALSAERSILYSGTRLIRVRNVADTPARAVVIRTGFNTTKGNLIRNMMFPRPSTFSFYRDSMRFIGVLSVPATIAFVATLVNFIRMHVKISLIVTRALDIVTIVIPPALPASMAIGTSFALARLKMKNIYCISPPRINVSGKLNMFCFDKTGTLTEEGLDMLGLHVIAEEGELGPMIKRSESVNEESDLESIASDLSLLPASHLMTLSMATCHSVNSIDGSLIGDPLDVKMFEFTNWEIEDTGYMNEGSITTVVRPKGSPCSQEDLHMLPITVSANGDLDTNIKTNELGIIRCFEFVSALRRMSVLVKVFQKFGVSAFVKGAPESMRDICDMTSIPSNFDSTLDHYTIRGFRVIAMAMKSFPNLSWAKAQKLKREQVESELTFLGFLVFENKLKPATKGVIKSLHQGDFRTSICTGDNILTAVSVARECKIIGRNTTVYLPRLLEKSPYPIVENAEGDLRIVWESALDSKRKLLPLSLIPASPEAAYASNDYTIGCTGHILEYLIDHCSTDALFNVLMKCNVYARMSPDQKQRLVECFQKLEYCVGFCGDGANDCGALKAADVGLSLSEAEASVAAPFTSKVPDIRCTLDLVLEGRSALVTSFAAFKFMAMYSLTEFTTVSLLYVYAANLSNIQFVYIDLVTILPLAACMSQAKTGDTVTPEQPISELISIRALCSLLGQVAVQVLFQVAIYFLTRSCPWYVPIHSDPRGENIESHLNTVLFSFSVFQYLIVALIFSSNVPFQKPIMTNRPLVTLASALFVVDVFFLVCPASWAKSMLEMKGIPLVYRLTLLALVVLDGIVSIVVSQLAYPAVKWTLNRVFRRQKKLKIYEKILQETRPSDSRV